MLASVQTKNGLVKSGGHSTGAATNLCFISVNASSQWLDQINNTLPPVALSLCIRAISGLTTAAKSWTCLLLAFSMPRNLHHLGRTPSADMVNSRYLPPFKQISIYVVSSADLPYLTCPIHVPHLLNGPPLNLT